jgi:hypothetical protein
MVTSSPRGQAPTPNFDFDEEDEPVEEIKPVQQRGDEFKQERKAFAAALYKETALLKRPADSVTLRLDLGSAVLPLVVKWLESVTYAGKIVTYERVSRQVLRVTLPWNVARYIVEHVEQFAESGIIDTMYNPVVDPAVMVEIEAEKAATEELARNKKEEAEAAEELERRKKEEAEAAEIQSKADAAVRAAADEVQRRQSALRRVFIDWLDEDSGTLDYIGETPTVFLLRDYLKEAFPHTVSIKHQSDSMLSAELAPSLLAAIETDRRGFIENGWVEEK